MRRGREGIVGVAIALVVTVAGCGGGEGIRSPQSAPLEFDDGFARLDVPLSPRNVVPAAGGHWVFVYGGWWIDSDGGHTAGDGALYDVERQEWLPVPAGPFEERLWGPASVWTGREFVVLGTPCADPDVDEENVDFVQCDATRMAAAAFDPAAAQWTTVVAPDVTDLGSDEWAITPVPIGSAGGRAVFSLGPTDLSVPTKVVAIGPDSPPEEIPPLPVAQNRCTLGDRLLAFGSGDTGHTPAPAGAIEPTNTWAYRDGTWIHQGGLGPSTTVTYGSIGGQVSCTPSAIGYVGLAGAGRDAGRGGEVDWFDPASGWRRLPDLPPVAGATAATVAEVAGTRLVWIGDRIALLRDGAWSRRSAAGYLRRFPGAAYPAPPGSDAAPMIAVLPDLAVSGRYLVGRAYVEDLALVVVDPDRLPPAT